MKKQTIRALAALVCGLLMSVQAHAWMALAASKQGMTFINWNSPTVEAAMANALRNCNEHGWGCEVHDGAVEQTVMVVAQGVGGWAFVSDRDPDQARQAALQQCATQYRGCEVTQTAWDGGPDRLPPPAGFAQLAAEAARNEAAIVKAGAKSARASCATVCDYRDGRAQCKGVYPDGTVVRWEAGVTWVPLDHKYVIDSRCPAP